MIVTKSDHTITQYTKYSQGQGLETPPVNPQLMAQLMAIWIGSFQTQPPSSYSSCILQMRVIGAFPIPTPGVSLGGLSPQGILAPPILNTCPMKELHTAMPRPASPGSSSLTDPHHRVQASPPRFAKSYFVSWFC